MTGLQVQAHSHSLADLGRKRLGVIRPRAPARCRLAPRRALSLLGVLAAVYTDGEVALAKLEAGRALQVDCPLLGLGQQPPAHEHHRKVLEGRDA
eukprot:2455437-Prymnesium_polylepis.1